MYLLIRYALFSLFSAEALEFINTVCTFRSVSSISISWRLRIRYSGSAVQTLSTASALVDQRMHMFSPIAVS